MKGLVIIPALLALVLIISGCTSLEECKKPFIAADGGCCLDLDDDAVCDEEQGTAEEAKPEDEIKPVEVEEKELIEPKQEATEETPPAVQEPVQEPETETITEIEETEEETENQTIKITPDESKTAYENLLSTFAQKVTGYKYVYNANWYYVRGDKIRTKLHDAVPVLRINIGGTYRPLYYYDNVYLDKKEKIATGYCEGTDLRLGDQCLTLKVTDVAYPLIYADYKTKLPEEWLFEYLDQTPSEVGESKYYLSGRKVTKIVFEDEDTGKETRMYFDLVTGLPIKIEIIQNGDMIDSYSYDYLSANTVREEDVIHRKASDIPSSENFYSIYSQR